MWLACPLRRSRTLFELRERSTLLTVEERRLTAFRNASNVVRIVSPEWRAWLRLGGGGKSVPPSPTQLKMSASAQRNRTWAAERQGAAQRDSYRSERGAPRMTLLMRLDAHAAHHTEVT